MCLMSCAREKLKLGRLLGCGEHELLGTAFKMLIISVYSCISLPARTRASPVSPLIPGSLMENGSEVHPPSYRMGSEDILPGIKPREADHSPLMPRLRMHGFIPPLPYTSSWSGA